MDANIVLNFDENVDTESGNITIKKTSDNSTVEAIDVTGGQVSGLVEHKLQSTRLQI